VSNVAYLHLKSGSQLIRGTVEMERRDVRLRWITVCFCVLNACGAPPQAGSPAAQPSPVPSAPVFPSPIVVGSPGTEGERVSLMAVLANPKAWHGKPVRVTGFMHLEFEGDQFCLHREDVEFLLLTNCVWLAVPESRELLAINDRYVGVEGVVDADGRGHMGLFQATIRATSVGALPSRAALEAHIRSQQR
jgi:hypothetical protein